MRRLQWFTNRARFESDLEEEMQHHLALKSEERGIEAAHRQFGNVTLLKEDSRAIWTWTFWEQLSQDLRYALRNMAANKVFTAMAAISLALGIGANTAIYSFMDAVMIRALPVQNPDRLVILNWRSKGEAPVIHDHWGSSYNDAGSNVSPNFPFQAYEFLRDHNQDFSALFSYANAGLVNLMIQGQAELGSGQYVSGNYFSGLGVRPAIGRLLNPDDDKPGAAPVVTIAYSLWQRRFGGRSDAVGKSMLINGRPFTISGVSAPEFFGITPQDAPQVFVPVRLIGLVDARRFGNVDASFIDKHNYWIEMMGRLKPGVSLQQAQSSLTEPFHRWVAATAENDKERAVLPSLWLQPGGSGVDALRRRYSKPLFILMTMVGLILAVACANLANMLLARAASRRREMAVRLTLGAGRLRVIRQLLTESLLLSFTGGLLGILVAALGIRSLTFLLENGDEGFTLRAQMDWRVLLFTMLVALASGFLFGLAPALQATRIDIIPALKETRASNPRARKRRFGIPFGLSHVLVVSQIAISLLLVSAAGLFVRTLANLESVDVGFNRDNVLVFSVDAVQAGYKDAALTNFYFDLQRRFSTIPGVRSATMTQMPLVANWMSTTGVSIPGIPKGEGRGPSTSITQVGAGFFETMQIPILQGRAIDERDRADAASTAVVNQVFANKYFPGVPAIGRHFGLGPDGKVDTEIVGLARSARYSSLKDEIPPVIYVSYQQASKYRPLEWMFFELRTAVEPMTLAKTIQRTVHDVSPKVPLAGMTTQSRKIESTYSQERTFADLCACFGILALATACAGLYGSMAYAVTRRTSEIGIRMALGAERKKIIWLVLREVIILGAVGLFVGSLAVWQTTALLKSFLFGLRPDDPATLAAAAAILIGCTILAGYIPAFRASRIDPMTAVRHE